MKAGDYATADELKTLVNLDYKPSTIHPNVFPNTPAEDYWSKTTDMKTHFLSNTFLAYFVDFSNGIQYTSEVDHNPPDKLNVRLVRKLDERDMNRLGMQPIK